MYYYIIRVGDLVGFYSEEILESVYDAKIQRIGCH